jgi:GntR family phosphonate transport system transcriptional regulator
MTTTRRAAAARVAGTNPFESTLAPLARGAGVTVWKQIEAQLATEIRDRRYADTGRLPSENALAQRFGVNRHTLRQALAALEHDGLVRIEQGRGAFVQQDWVDYTLSRRTRYSENIQHNQLLPSKQLLSAREEPAAEKVARALQLRKGTRVLRAELLDEAGGAPIALATMYFPAARFAGLLEMLHDGERVTAVLKRFGIDDYFRKHNRITTQMPAEEVARLLRQPRTRPVLLVESIDIDTAGTPIKFGETVFSGDRVQLVFDPANGDG